MSWTEGCKVHREVDGVSARYEAKVMTGGGGGVLGCYGSGWSMEQKKI